VKAFVPVEILALETMFLMTTLERSYSWFSVMPKCNK